MSPIDMQIKIFDNYITIYNPGGLYENLTVDQLKNDNYQAIARNKLIAEAFTSLEILKNMVMVLVEFVKESRNIPQ
jgi:predicted HTH transcriptional regulator